jgi:hypothetical protein
VFSLPPKLPLPMHYLQKQRLMHAFQCADGFGEGSECSNPSGASGTCASEVRERRKTMDPLEQRLNNLWLRHTAPSNHVAAETEPEPPNRMGVTLRAATKISDIMLTPGRYVFQLPDPASHPDHLEIFNDDQTSLIANLTLGALPSSDATWEAGKAWTSMMRGPRPRTRVNRPADSPTPVSLIHWSDTNRTADRTS